MIEKLFKVRESGSTVKREIYTGLLTFLAVAYILAVNPAILGATGMDRGGVLYATALAGFAGGLAMALLANYPLALAPAMGLNAFFAFTVVKTMGYSWQFALFAVFVEGIVFLLLTLCSLREKIVEAIPLPLKYAMGVGVGLFISLIACKNGYVVKSHPDTLLTFQNFSKFHTEGISAILALIGVGITSWLMTLRVNGAILVGIIFTWGLGMFCESTGIYHVVPEMGFNSLYPDFSKESFTTPFNGFCGLFGAAFEVDKWHCTVSGQSGWMLLKSVDFIVVCFAFFFTDFFDTIGTINGAVVNTPLMKEDGTIPRLRGALLADSIATFTGGILGTSTTTTFAESAAGINAGARTGLAALTCAVLFLISLVAAPIFLAIPGFATAPALIIVGFLMLKAVVHIDFSDVAAAVPAYLLIIGTVFTYSISNGLGFGIIAWCVLNFRIKGRVNWLLWLISMIFIVKYICL